MKREILKKQFLELCEAHNKYKTEALEAVWTKGFLKMDAKLFTKTVDKLKLNTEFPSLSTAMTVYKLLQRGMSANKIDSEHFGKSCDWCEQGKIYFERMLNPYTGREGPYSYVGACAICYPDGNGSMFPIDPRKFLWFRELKPEQGGPIIIDESHIERRQAIQRGEDPDARVKRPDGFMAGVRKSSQEPKSSDLERMNF